MIKQRPLTEEDRQVFMLASRVNKYGIDKLKENHVMFIPNITSPTIGGSVQHLRKKMPNWNIKLRKGNENGIDGVYVIREGDKQ